MRALQSNHASSNLTPCGLSVTRTVRASIAQRPLFIYSVSIYKMDLMLIFILRPLGGLISTRKVFRMLPGTEDRPRSLAATLVSAIALSNRGPQETDARRDHSRGTLHRLGPGPNAPTAGRAGETSHGLCEPISPTSHQVPPRWADARAGCQGDSCPGAHQEKASRRP